MLVKVKENGEVVFPYSYTKFRQENPQTSFPSRVSDEFLARYGIYNVELTDPPDHDELTHRAMPKLEGGGTSWRQIWEVIPLSEKDAASNVKMRRNRKLQETDWCAMSDVTMSEEMRSYRQALRDITEQEGFPHSITWPEKPE